MQSQATLGICAVRYSGDHIASVRAVPDLKGGAALSLELSRRALVQAIVGGRQVVTLHRKADGGWGHWDAAMVIPVDGNSFVKLVDDHLPLDDLGDLPEY